MRARRAPLIVAALVIAGCTTPVEQDPTEVAAASQTPAPASSAPAPSVEPTASPEPTAEPSPSGPLPGGVYAGPVSM